MSNAKSRVGLFLLLIAAAMALLTMPVHQLWGLIMLFLVLTAAGCVFLSAGIGEAQGTARRENGANARENSS
jgi:hypothetical protein